MFFTNYEITTLKEHPHFPRRLVLNFLLVIVTAFSLYQMYAIGFPSEGRKEPPHFAVGQSIVAEKSVVQVNVLNGCGVSGVGQRMTSVLRSVGYDVVEMGNYKTFDVKESMVIDRSGNSDVANKIAAQLGISDKNVLQQISSEYFVTASVVIGRDYKSLHAWK